MMNIFIYLSYWILFWPRNVLQVSTYQGINKSFLFFNFFHLKNYLWNFWLYLCVFLFNYFSLRFYFNGFNDPRKKFIRKTFSEDFKLIAWDGFFKNLKIFCVKYHYIIFICNQNEFVLFNKLTKCYLFIL